MLDKFIEIEKCPVCESDNIIKTLTAIDNLVTKDKFNIWECKECSCRFTSPIPNEREIGKYYESDEYISHSEKGTSLIDKIYKIVQKITLRSKKRKVENLFNREAGFLLDIGCGTGDFLYTMKSAGWKVAGVEVNPIARKIAEEKISTSVFSPSEFFKSNNKYNAITMWHSLEHLHNLKDYVQKIIDSLNKNGILLIAVPNYQSFDANYYKENWAAYDVPRHLYHFSFEAMEKLFDEFGFKIIEYKQLPFDPFYISMLSNSDKKIIKALLIGLRSYLLGCRDPKKGSSILYILKASNDN